MSKVGMYAKPSPKPEKDREDQAVFDVPFASIHVRVCKPSSSKQGNAHDWDQSDREYLEEVLDGFERVLNLALY